MQDNGRNNYHAAPVLAVGSFENSSGGNSQLVRRSTRIPDKRMRVGNAAQHYFLLASRKKSNSPLRDPDSRFSVGSRKVLSISSRLSWVRSLVLRIIQSGPGTSPLRSRYRRVIP